jgi:hypothetical protein
MAIDTREKRQAVAALSGAHYFGIGTTPNSAKDQEWRQQSAYGYSGILAEEPAAPPVVTDVDSITTAFISTGAITPSLEDPGILNTVYRETSAGDVRITSTEEERVLPS